MATAKKLGIWMDHSNAHLMEFNKYSVELKTIESEFNHQTKADSLKNGEKLMHNKEQQQQWEYYSKIGEIIENYDNVLLFGPTEAKVELLNVLKADKRFTDKQIEIEQTDKMTDNQQHAFVKDYFSRF
jgi:hypothetical protein